MNTKPLILILTSLIGLLSVTQAGPRNSASYSIPAEAIDQGGQRATSSAYTQRGSAGLVGTRSAGPSGVVNEGGYVAQVPPATSVPLQIVSAVSRKTHGGAGVFDINLPLSGLAGVECRVPAAGGAYQVVVTFSTPVSANSVSVTSSNGQAGGALSVNGAVVTLNLTGVANAQTLGLTLLQVSNGSTTADVVIPMGVLLGDTNGSGGVSSSDISQTKSRSGQTLDAANFRSDVNASGTITASDIGQVKAQSGTSLP